MVLPPDVVRAARGLGITDFHPPDTIKAWLDDGGDISGVDEDGYTILNLSLSYENVDVVKCAIAHGADVNQPGDSNGEPPLYTALGTGEKEFTLEVISLLLDAGANINATTPNADSGVYIAGETALTNAIDWFRYDNDEFSEKALAWVSLLLRRGAKLDNCWGGRSAEECLRHVEEPSAFPDLQDAYDVTRSPTGKTKEYVTACKKLIADERRRRYMLPRRAFLRLRSLQLRGRAKPDALLDAVARLPNELAWHVLSFWPAEADVAPPSTPSPRSPPPIISDEALLSELDGLVQAQKANSR